MARVDIQRLDGLINDFKQLANLPMDVLKEMLNAEADVVIDAQKRRIQELGLKDTGQMQDSITRTAVQKEGRGMYLNVYPQGERSDGIRNEEVGFINEFGAPHIGMKASGWMKEVNEECENEAVKEAEEVYNRFLNKNNF